MHHRFTLGFSFAFLTLIALAALAGCVDVPDSIRAQFAAPSAQERTNYRPGRHGSAQPLKDPAEPTMKAASNDADAGAGMTTTTSASTDTKEAKDGGVQ
jgi:hypothetical protein